MMSLGLPDLNKRDLCYWAYQWKMQFNPNPNKQPDEAIFSQKASSNNFSYRPINFLIGIHSIPG